VTGLVLASAGALWAIEGTTPAAGALDGQTFVGEMGKQGSANGDKDEFVFQNGTFRSIACDPYGFGDGAYNAATEGDAIQFQAETTSPTDGRMVWEGTIRGQSLEGAATWYRDGKDPEAFWLRGTLQADQPS
jgi:hypothetical protein